MQIRQFISYLLSCAILMTALPSCKKNIGQSLSLRSLTSYLDYQATKSGITVRVRQLTETDCQHIIGEQAKRLFKKNRRRQPIYPIQLSITNSTNRLTALKAENIDLALTPASTVARRLQKNTFAQIFGNFAAGFFITALLATGSFLTLGASGIVLLVAGSHSALAPAAILGGAALLAAPTFLIIGTPVASTVKGVETAKQNAAIRKEIKAHTLKDTIVIESQKTVDTLIFVEKPNYKNTFSITLSNPHNAIEKISFPVQLKSR